MRKVFKKYVFKIFYGSKMNFMGKYIEGAISANPPFDKVFTMVMRSDVGKNKKKFSFRRMRLHVAESKRDKA